MNIEKLKQNLEKRKSKRQQLKNRSDVEDLIRESDAVNVLIQAELIGLNKEIQHLERKILEHQ